jgi:hypothetical protein
VLAQWLGAGSSACVVILPPPPCTSGECWPTQVKASAGIAQGWSINSRTPEQRLLCSVKSLEGNYSSSLEEGASYNESGWACKSWSSATIRGRARRSCSA